MRRFHTYIVKKMRRFHDSIYIYICVYTFWDKRNKWSSTHPPPWKLTWDSQITPHFSNTHLRRLAITRSNYLKTIYRKENSNDITNYSPVATIVIFHRQINSERGIQQKMQYVSSDISYWRCYKMVSKIFPPLLF